MPCAGRFLLQALMQQIGGWVPRRSAGNRATAAHESFAAKLRIAGPDANRQMGTEIMTRIVGNPKIGQKRVVGKRLRPSNPKENDNGRYRQSCTR
jgi:hypothetical protein